MTDKRMLVSFDRSAVYEIEDEVLIELVALAGGNGDSDVSQPVVMDSNGSCTNLPCADNIGCTNAGCTEVNVTCPTQKICAQVFC